MARGGEAPGKRRGPRIFYGFLLVLFVGGLLLVALGTRDWADFWNQLAIGTDLSVGPAALVAILFRLFLIEDVRQDFVDPLTKQVRDTLVEALPERLDDVLGQYQQEIADISATRQGGLIRCYPNRQEAVVDFIARHEATPDPGPMTVVGSSLMGLLPDKDSAFARLVAKNPAAVTFVLTHPVVADLRAQQENRPLTEIGVEIVQRLRLLNELGVPAGNVYLYRGAPTCFGIKTRNLMLLNPYPYESVAMESPCLLVRREPNLACYFYDTFRTAHFNRTKSVMTEQLTDLEKSASELESRLEAYSEVAHKVAELVRATGEATSPDRGI